MLGGIDTTCLRHQGADARRQDGQDSELCSGREIFGQACGTDGILHDRETGVVQERGQVPVLMENIRGNELLHRGTGVRYRQTGIDMEKLAMQITEIVKDPFEARHLPIRNLSIDPENDNVLKFDIQSTQEKKDTSKNAKTEKLTYHFKYDITSKKLTFNTKDEDSKYPDWANVSPDGLVGIYMKNSNLFYMDTLNMRKAAKDPKDSTIVEHRITSPVLP